MRAALLLFLIGISAHALEIEPDDPRIRIDGCAFRETIESGSKKIVRMNREIPHPDFAQWENPGARIRIRTNSKMVRFRVAPNHLRPRDKKAKGGSFVCHINGNPENSRTIDPQMEPGKFRFDGDGSMREYELIMPQNGSYDFLGISLSGNPDIRKPESKRKRIVFYGDDLLCATPDSIAETIPCRIADLNHYDTVNMGFSRILLTPWHAETLSKISMNALVVLVGLHDSEFGTTIPVFRKNLERFIAEIRKKKSRLKLIFIAPFQCRGNDKLTPYRKAILDLKEENLTVIDGAQLVPSDPSFFEKNRKNLNQKGLRHFTKKLAEKLRKL